MSTTSPSLLQLIAAFGFGSIVAAILGVFGARAVAISSHRQNWINALSDDLVNFLKEVDALHFRMTTLLIEGKPDDLERQQECRDAAMVAYRRVLMRLNMTETLHVNLADRLNDLMTIGSSAADRLKMEAAVNASREVLKHEWAVTKYGIFTRPVLAIKAWWRKRYPERQ